jgi:serine/threonine protein kinase
MVKKVFLDRYEIIETLGRGGSAEVFKAFDRKMRRIVAIKRLDAFSKSAARAVREAQAVASLDHPNVVSIFDLAKDRRYHYLVMEYIDGVTLSSILEAKPRLSVEESLVIGIKVAEALGVAHSQNIVHRDIKPENIMITKDGNLKVADFGIAHVASSTMTHEGDVLGTFAYMSPEQARGGRIDARTDIFSLGVVLYRMLSGESPFAASSPGAMIFKILNTEPEPLSYLNSAVSPTLDELVNTALAKGRTKRVQTISDLEDGLLRCRLTLEPADEILKPLYAMISRTPDVVQEIPGRAFSLSGSVKTRVHDLIKSRKGLFDRTFIALLTSISFSYVLSKSVFYTPGMTKAIPFIVFVAVWLFPRIGLLASLALLALPLADIALVLPLFLFIAAAVYGLSFFLVSPFPTVYSLLAPYMASFGFGFVFPIMTGYFWNPVQAFVIGALGGLAMEISDLCTRNSIRYMSVPNKQTLAQILGGDINPFQSVQAMIQPFIHNPLLLLQPLFWGAIAALVAILVRRKSLQKDIIGFIVSASLLLVGQAALLSNYKSSVAAFDRLMQTFGASFIILVGILLILPRTPEEADEAHFEPVEEANNEMIVG